MSQLTIKSFGIISDILGQESIEMDFEISSKLLRDRLIETYPKLQSMTFSIAVNKVIHSESIVLNEGDEIALLPPFSGG
jgi:molybdopterin converting factor small subunit